MKFISLNESTVCHSIVKEAFKKLIEPKYGNQEKALNKILAGNDRNCEVLFVKNKPKGLIVYKVFLQNEFGLNDAFELKTALLFNHTLDQGLGKFLFKRVNYLAKKSGAKYVFFTLSEKNPRLLKHFEAAGWVNMGKGESDDNAYCVHILYKELARR